MLIDRLSCHKRFYGSALQEYLLPACLIGMVVLAGTPTLVSNLGQYFRTSHVKSLGKVNNPTMASQIANSSMNTVAPNPLPFSSSAFSQLSGPEASELGLQKQFQQEAGQLIQDVETLGAAGASQLMSHQFLSDLETMSNPPQLTDEQKQSLKNLAAQVNRVASIQRLLEDSAQESHGDSDNFQETLKSFDGKEYSSAELIMLIGSSSDNVNSITESAKPFFKNKQNSLSTEESHESLKTYGLELAAIVELYEKAKSNGALSDPRVNVLVTLYAQKAIYLSQYMAYASAQIIVASAPPEALTATVVSNMTKQQARNIEEQVKPNALQNASHQTAAESDDDQSNG